MSKSFMQGFGRGLIAPSLVFVPLRVQRPRAFEPSVERAWQDVGRALRSSAVEETRRVQKTRTEIDGTNESKRRRSKITA